MTEAAHDGASEAIALLCAHFGIALDYHDIWGAHQPVPRETLLALLAEFGVRLHDGAQAGALLEAERRASWSCGLPPVRVIRASSADWALPLRMPASMGRLRWQLWEEDGGKQQGEIDTAALPETAAVEIDGTRWCERQVPFARGLPMGYHRLRIEGLEGETLLISAPERCWRPAALRDGGRVWGPALQLYALRSRRNWGIGDFTDLAQLITQMAPRGADIVGLNPLHALFPHNPAHASPYSPSSRRWLNVLCIDVEAVPDFAHCEAARRLVGSLEFQTRLAALRELPLVDYAGVAQAKFEVLELLFAHFRACRLTQDGRDAQDDTGFAFLAFVAEGGESLRRHALFEALQAHFHAADAAVWGWPLWPEDYRDPESPAVEAFARQHAQRVQFHQYLQWLAAGQLARANAHCKALGLGIGLYLDLAVSSDRGGSDVWSEGALFAAEASVGAPPDEFNPSGQGWGLPPLRPDRLRAEGYRFFIDTLRANMRHAGALRIDHVMGLMRLFWIPAGGTAREGGYVRYPLDEMLAIVALESQRHRCLVIGEDLGTVQPEMREALARFDILSYRLLFFEREADGAFKPAAAYPAQALAAVGTHDLPTLAGWWCGEDLRLRLQLGLIPDEAQLEQQLLDRARQRVQLLLAVRHAGLLSAEEIAQASSESRLAPRTVEAVHAFLAEAPALLMMVQLEDVLGVVEQANMPGTTHEQPNWQRKLPADLHALAASEALDALGRTLARLRPQARVADASQRGSMQARIPRATYRLQFHKGFRFDDAIRVLPYLARLGISHVYCSPIQRARAGSMHGYDVVAHDQVNPELGGRAGFERFVAALRVHGMGQLVDLVPNHMGVMGADNAWWMDVLENGPASLYAQHFDIDWQPLNPELAGKVLVPVLGDHYGDVLMSGDLVLRFEEGSGSLAVYYFEHRFPLAPESYPRVLGGAAAQLDEAALAAQLAGISSAFGRLLGHDASDDPARAERARDKELLKTQLAQLAARQPAVVRAITARAAELNLPSARDELHALIEVQAWRLAYWRVAADDINYRRFFDINSLAGLRMEREEVFEATQSFALDLAASGQVDGLRIDHPDGLYDPARYFRQLQEGYARRAGLVLAERDAEGRPARPLYVVAEKIKAEDEEVPEDWHVHGTTGYRFANVANGVLIDTAAAEKFEKIWRNFTGVRDSFQALARAGKRDIMRSALASELAVLSTELLRIARADRRTRDYTFNALQRALGEIAACLPVYRTYIIEAPSQQDERFISWAAREARRGSREADVSIYDFVQQTLLGRAVPGAEEALQRRVLHLAIRFQQFSAPVTAKGVEDTAFYRYFPLSALNEVGGEPAHFGMTVDQFHEASADRARHWPHTMLASSTHDNKRSEDVRCRIDVLSEMPGTWRLALRRWRALTRGIRRKLEAGGAPSGAPSSTDEYLLYQTLLGTLPAGGLDDSTREPYTERIVGYMQKAAREAKLHTRWTNPDEAYEQALEGFVRAVLSREADPRFVDDLQTLARTLAWFGALNSLSLTLLKFGSPGVPDVYQGNELMDLSLVDPDNRRPVDYALRVRCLDELEAMVRAGDLPAHVAALVSAAAGDGRAKLWVAWRMLSLRREQPALFREGDYRGLQVDGAKAAHVVAFMRRHEDRVLVLIAARLFSSLAAISEPPLGEVWEDTTVRLPEVPEGTRFENVLTGETLVVHGGVIRMAAAFAHFPGAALWAKP
ncbi:malto-oligosyltrehalose synthase [Variovorax sp. RA8]|uniref:malto-oligosyltrehalose synthase n=1 Tax=Variovorax sp. (strain JCM 16519 / RA8) TaxID=662548 RepID=UPI0013164506|nr:malto-oligosyltrehalose synthase [Variovorax sp. RA8]VTU17036.1 Maltooligosyl trehalose synthase [Variovorax sp. RA8]